MFILSFFLRKSFVFYLIFLCCAGWADLTQETIYLTWQKDPCTTMTIQWISLAQEKQSLLIYRPQQSMKWKKAIGKSISFPQAPQYSIHSIEIQDLQPNTEYVFKVFPYQEEYRFLTAPSSLEKNIHFVVGGDMYHDGIELMKQTCRQAAQTEPLFALLGGDIAYAVTSQFPKQKIERWIEWIKAWHETMMTPNGLLIPVISAIGNHDLIGQFDQTPEQAAVFSSLFPMPGKHIYNVLDFSSYLSIFILDSGHANPISGLQTNWLKLALEDRQHIPHRLAIYHVPAYPSIRHMQSKQSIAIRRFWVPLFEKLGIQMAFEHHDHAYKRTYPLLRNRINPKGVVYLGDGGWGVQKARTLRNRRSYLAKFAATQYFLSVRLTPTQQIIKSFDMQGQVIDEYTQKLELTLPSLKQEKSLELEPVVLKTNVSSI